MTRSEFQSRFGKWLNYVRISNKQSWVDVASRLNVTVGLATSWGTGNSLPDAYNYQLIVDIYGKPDFL